MKTESLPSQMSAHQRRDAWYAEEIPHARYLRDYDLPLKEALFLCLNELEGLLGAEAVDTKISAIVPGNQPMDWDWKALPFDGNVSPASGGWECTKFLDDAGLYGLLGAAPSAIPFKTRKSWVAALPLKLGDWRRNVRLGKDANNILLLIDLALSRHAMDTGLSLASISSDDLEEEGEVSIPALAVFGGVSEGRIRNLLTSGESCLVRKSGHSVTASSAKEWLAGRKEFYPSIWDLPEDEKPEPQELDFSGEVVFVPVASDGGTFHPGLARNGKYTVGAKGDEVQFAQFQDALSALHKMSTPRWRRPNMQGNWGIVSGKDWKRVERHTLGTSLN